MNYGYLSPMLAEQQPMDNASSTATAASFPLRLRLHSDPSGMQAMAAIKSGGSCQADHATTSLDGGLLLETVLCCQLFALRQVIC